jgi:transposase-like protein
MPQIQLPLFPSGTTAINESLGFEYREGQVVYINGHLPVFTHEEEDLESFRFFTTQLIVNGTATQGEIARAFGVPLVTIKRYVKRYRQKGAKGFFMPPKRREGRQLTAEMLSKARSLLEDGQSVPEVSRATGVLANTIHKAIRAGRLPQPAKKSLRGVLQGGSANAERAQRDR